MEIVLLILPYVLLIILGLVSWKLLPAYLNKKAENLATKEDISEITEKIESVKSTFEKDKIKFSWFHQKQAETLGELYSKLSECVDQMLHFTSNDYTKENKYDEAYHTASQYFLTANDYFKAKRIYLDSQLQKRVNDIFIPLREAFLYKSLSQNDPTEYKRRQELLNTAFDKVQQDAKQILNEIENEFRKILSAD